MTGQVRACFEAPAKTRDVTVCPAQDDVTADADERAEQVSSVLAKLQGGIDHIRS